MSETRAHKPDEPVVEQHTDHLSARDMIDPHHTLPDVDFESHEPTDFGTFSRQTISVMQNGRRVGGCDLIVEFGSKVHFDGIEIDRTARGKGVGLAMYLHAIEKAQSLGLPFETQEITQTKDAKKIWEHLVRVGVAEVVEPFRETRSVDGEPRYEGRYVVPASESSL